MQLTYQDFLNIINVNFKDWDDEFIVLSVKDEDITNINNILGWGVELGYFTEYDKVNNYIRIFKREEFLKYLNEPKKKYLIHYYNPSFESYQNQFLTFADKEIIDYCTLLASKGCLDIHYTHYDQDGGAPNNPYVYYN